MRPLGHVDELHLAPVTEDQLDSHGFVVDDVGYGPATMIQAMMDKG
ncbi:MAG: hypothetical protein OXU48_06940 [candidate division Zixibacteria bacterium]|nr:hypothetical protein [candidate division Zixibacteria bacterium]